MADTTAAATFIASTARLVDRRLFELHEGGAADGARAALLGYRNDDGGFGQGLEPDIRAPTSQPAPLQYALEILSEVGAAGDDPIVVSGLDWAGSVSSDSGGIGLLVGEFEGWPRAPWFGPEADSFLTPGIAGSAWKLGASHPWLDRATEFSWDRVATHDMSADMTSAYWWKYLVHFLDHVGDEARALAELERIREPLLASGAIGLDPRAASEQLSPLVVSPEPGLRSRMLFDDATIDAFLDLLDAGQRDDGGWDFDWPSWNPVTSLEWRGKLTVEALAQLRAHGRD